MYICCLHFFFFLSILDPLLLGQVRTGGGCVYFLASLSALPVTSVRCFVAGGTAEDQGRGGRGRSIGRETVRGRFDYGRSGKERRGEEIGPRICNIIQNHDPKKGDIRRNESFESQNSRKEERDHHFFHCPFE